LLVVPLDPLGVELEERRHRVWEPHVHRDAGLVTRRPTWVRDLRDCCTSLRIPLFFKQAGGLILKAGGRLLDGRAWDEFPAVAGVVAGGA
jgi:hypothetical protein